MRAVTVTIATDLLRLGAASAGNEALQINLSALADGVSRARASARFSVGINMPWHAEAGALVLVTTRGYLVEMSLAQVASFLARALPGHSFAVTITIDDAAKVPARWTDARLASLAKKMDATDPVAIRAVAAAKRATVADWTDGDRKTAVLEAAARMDQCADAVEAIRSGFPFGQGGGEGGEGGMN